MMRRLSVYKRLALVFLLLIIVILWLDGSEPDINHTEIFPRQLDSSVTSGRTGLAFEGPDFSIDGKPVRLISGSFHYFRTHPKLWLDRLEKMKACGLNTVTSYVPWNLHEAKRGQVILDGFWNLVDFIKQVDKVGMYLIIRPGPFICAEWEYGGLPSWLLRDPKMIVRRSLYEPFLKAVDSYFSKLLPVLARYTWKKGGPIIAFQIENEFGGYGVEDQSYLNFLLEAHNKYGVDSVYITSDGAHKRQLVAGSVAGSLMTVNLWNHADRGFQLLQELQPNRPKMITEFWPGWFDHWRENHHTKRTSEVLDRMEIILKRHNASLNFYMFVGGTNHNFYNGANNSSGKYQPTITSYDYDAPISESGDITEKYTAIRKYLISSRLTAKPGNIPLVPGNAAKTSYGPIKMDHFMSLENLVQLSLKQHGHIQHESTRAMELLDCNDGNGQSYGWILYRAKFKIGKTLRIAGFVRDRMQVYVNGQFLKTLEWYTKDTSIKIPASVLQTKVEHTLDLLVENMGRVNFKGGGDGVDVLDTQRKGFFGSVYIMHGSDEDVITDWLHVPLQFDSDFNERLLNEIDSWNKISASKSPTKRSPAALKGKLIIQSTPTDTFLDISGWGKGIVLINGENLGRYWSFGPQITLYIPAPYLKEGENTIIMFDLEQYKDSVVFVDKPKLDRMQKI